MKYRLKAPSPAFLISLIALFVALGGTSLAAASYVNGAYIKPHSIAENRLTKGAIKSLHGAKGATGVNGSAVAYAHVLANGTLDRANSKNVSASTSPAPGRYCLKVTVPVVSVSATVDAYFDRVAFASGAVAQVSGSDFISVVCGIDYNALIVVENTSGLVSYPSYAVFN